MHPGDKIGLHDQRAAVIRRFTCADCQMELDLGYIEGRTGLSCLPGACEVSSYLNNGHDVATKLRCLGLCKVEMSLGGLAGSVSRRRGDHPIGAAPASRGSF